MRLALRTIIVAAVLIVAASSGGANAQSYPTRPITIVVPYPAGGPTDTLARIMSDRLKAALGQTIVIENITGAGGSIGVGHVAHAAPDGYTLALGHNQTHVINAVTLKLNYDVVKDFEPVTLIADTPIWIVASKALPADDMNGFVAWLKENGDKANAGTVGVGGPNDLAALDFQKKTGTHFQLTPYRGGAPLLQDLLAGHIDFTFGQASTYLPYVRNGQIKAYGVLMPKRWWAAPEVPTLDELGIKGTYATFWHGIWAPKDTPKPIIAKLDSAFMETLADPAVKQRFKDVGQEMWPAAQQNPAGLAAQQKAEIERWWPIVKDAGIKPQ
jgi:tripartite-type tricarboxylate transporter receptor subunit TctC